MESSLGHVFRAVVMLACLALVPALAMYGKHIPAFCQSVQDAYRARTQKADHGTSGASDAPAFGSPAADSTGATAGRAKRLAKFRRPTGSLERRRTRGPANARMATARQGAG